MPEIHERRRGRLAAALTELDADAALVTRMVNVRYLTGFSGSYGAVLVPAAGPAVLATDGRYQEQSAAQAGDLERVIDRRVAGVLAERAAAGGVRRLAVETHDLTVDAHVRLVDAATPAALVSLGAAVDTMRAVKDRGEVALIARACAITDETFERLLPRIRPGRTERELAADLEHILRLSGADGPAFETIVAGGPNAAIPHHQPTDRPLEPGDLLTFDFGALVEGYHADMTRTIVLGQPDDWQVELHELVAEAAAAGRAALADGALGREVDAVARAVVDVAGRGADFVHGLGHGVGLEIHEAPALWATSVDTLAAGMVLTVEPGVYLPGRGGVRIEDTLLVSPAGQPARSLTASPRDLLAV